MSTALDVAAPAPAVSDPHLVPTRAETDAHQADLPTLCADRPLRTREIFVPNAYYGADAVVKRWAGLPPGYRLKVALAHGVAFRLAFYGAREHVPVLTYQWDLHRAALRRVGVSGRLLPMAAPFVYAAHLVGPAPVERAGTIAFLARVGPGTPADELDDRAQGLLDLPPELGPVTVCLRWQDVLAGNHLPFEDAGLRVVSAGHWHDPHFLYRLAHLLTAHRFVASNGLGSHVFYGVHAGCRYVDVLDDRASGPGPLDDAIAPPELLAGAVPVVAELAGHDEATQRDLVAPFLGAHLVRPPGQLRRELLRAEVIDRFALVRPGADERRRPAVPDTLRRPVRRLGRRLRTRAA